MVTVAIACPATLGADIRREVQVRYRVANHQNLIGGKRENRKNVFGEEACVRLGKSDFGRAERKIHQGSQLQPVHEVAESSFSAIADHRATDPKVS